MPRYPRHPPEGDCSQDTQLRARRRRPQVGAALACLPPALFQPHSLSSTRSRGCCHRAQGAGRCGWRGPHLAKAMGVGPRDPADLSDAPSVSSPSSQPPGGAGVCPTSREAGSAFKALRSLCIALHHFKGGVQPGEGPWEGTRTEGAQKTMNQRLHCPSPPDTCGVLPSPPGTCGVLPSPLGTCGVLTLTTGYLWGAALTTGHLWGAAPHHWALTGH